MTTKTIHFVSRRQLLVAAKDKVVTLKYALFDAVTGELIEYRDDLVYLHGAAAGTLPRLQSAVEGLGAGMKCEVSLMPDEAFGRGDPALRLRVRRADLPPDAAAMGASVQGEAEDGTLVSFRVTGVEPDAVMLDGNHPLAGRSLRFVVEVAAIRDATAQELAAGCAFRAGPAAPGTT